jgi:hypothetical protein
LNCHHVFAARYGGGDSETDVFYRRAPIGNREVAMSHQAELRVDVEAAKALIDWKSMFADEVTAHARRLAAESSHPERVTLLQYREAAQIAVRSLSTVILDEGASSGDQKAA